MRALVLTDVRRLEVREVEKPRPPPGWVLLRVMYSGICGSDVGGFLGTNELRKPPLIMGHEFSGIVEDVGSGVSRDIVGRLVTVNPIVSCGQCRYCRMGLRNLCKDRRIIGISYPGAFAEYVAVPASNIYPIEDPVIGSLIEPLATSYRVYRLSQASLGDKVLVIGAGAIGIFTIRLLNLAGIEDITVVEVNSNRLEWAGRFGARHLINARKEEPGKILWEIAPEGFDVIIDAVGSHETRSLAINSVRRAGRVVLVGLHDNITEIPGNVIVRSEIEVKGSFAYTDEDFLKTINIARKALTDVRSWVGIMGLEHGQKAFEEAASMDTRYVKILLTPGD